MVDKLPSLSMFDWVTIPAGRVAIVTEDNWRDNYIPKGHAVTFDLSAFEIAKYPVTNIQYKKFVQAQGYSQKEWWTDAGWAIRNDMNWIEPRYWANERFIGDHQPVIGVSWYEAVAFCRWLSEEVGETITLPTEQQWQRAVWAEPDGGSSEYTFAWGNEWDGDKCQHSVPPHESKQTSSVMAHENMDNTSPCGVVGMTGNVWEWSLTVYETGNQDVDVDPTRPRVLRGGSWSTDHPHYFRSVSRYVSYPNQQTDDRGFRIILA